MHLDVCLIVENCVLLGLDWVSTHDAIIFITSHVHAFIPFSFLSICSVVIVFCFFLSDRLRMAPKCKSNLTRNTFRSTSSLSSDLPVPSLHVRFHKEKAHHIRTSLRTFLNVAFIWSAMWFCRTFSTLLYPMSFTLGDGNLFVRYLWGVPSCSYKSFTPICTVSIPLYLNLLWYSEVHISLSLRILYSRYYTSRVAHPNYPACQRLRTVSKDKLFSHFCETPSIWGKR